MITKTILSIPHKVLKESPVVCVISRVIIRNMYEINIEIVLDMSDDNFVFLFMKSPKVNAVESTTPPIQMLIIKSSIPKNLDNINPPPTAIVHIGQTARTLVLNER